MCLEKFFVFLIDIYGFKQCNITPQKKGGIEELLDVGTSVGAWQFLPYLIRPGEYIGTQHGVGREEEKSGVRDRVSRAVGLLLGILEFVDVLGDTLHVLMVRLHLILEVQNVRGMKANTNGLEVVQQVSRLDGRVE